MIVASEAVEIVIGAYLLQSVVAASCNCHEGTEVFFEVHLGLPILLGTHSRSLDHLLGHLSSDAVFDFHLVIIFYSTFDFPLQ